MNIFNSDGWFARIFGTIGDIIVVNILFIICSIPIFTIGASMSAMYYTLLKKQRTGETGGIIKLFFKGFKDNFKKSTIAWLLFMLIAFVFHQCDLLHIDMLYRHLSVPSDKRI